MNDREKYQMYLCSREWAIIRDKVIERSGGICERCKRNPGENVHHLTYIRKYREKLEDLVHYCRACHEFTHNKSDYDPLEVTLSIYLAGKISKNCWRHSIVDNLRSYAPGEVASIRKSIFLKHHYVGPFFVACDHGCFHGENRHGVVEYRSCSDGNNTVESVPEMCLHQISVSDFVFAWIDSATAFGTIAEIGYAYAINKPVYICYPANPDFNVRDFWFINVKMAKACFGADDPKDGLLFAIQNEQGKLKWRLETDINTYGPVDRAKEHVV